jgi:uncharacterized protein
MAEDDVTVRENQAEHRFELYQDGERAGFTSYRPVSDQLFAFMHTETDPKFAGQGLANVLIGRTLDIMRGRGISVLPYCPFVKAYIVKHPDYLDLVPVDRRAAFGLPQNV